MELSLLMLIPWIQTSSVHFGLKRNNDNNNNNNFTVMSE